MIMCPSGFVSNTPRHVVGISVERQKSNYHIIMAMGPYYRQKSKYCMIIATMTFIIGKYRTFSNMQVD
jgi:hypothetical protein